LKGKECRILTEYWREKKHGEKGEREICTTKETGMPVPVRSEKIKSKRKMDEYGAE
jgi:hypothetical protein